MDTVNLVSSVALIAVMGFMAALIARELRLIERSRGAGGDAHPSDDVQHHVVDSRSDPSDDGTRGMPSP
jgi:hypothetical protein